MDNVLKSVLKSVLIVDDSLMMRKKLNAYIEDLNYNIVGVASDGEEAIRLSKELKPDIITMDVTMPNVDGITAVKEIKKDNPNVKIVMITSHGQEDIILRSLEAGAAAYLIKPIEKEKLGEVLSGLIFKNS